MTTIKPVYQCSVDIHTTKLVLPFPLDIYKPSRGSCR